MVFICHVILHWQCVSLTFMVPFLVSSGLVSIEVNSRSRRGGCIRHGMLSVIIVDGC